MTRIQDMITYADGTLASGRIVLNWPSYQFGGVTIAPGQQPVPIAPDGSFTVDVYPTIGATPTGVFFTAVYKLDKGPVYREYWMIPSLPVVSIGAIRTIPQMVTN